MKMCGDSAVLVYGIVKTCTDVSNPEANLAIRKFNFNGEILDSLHLYHTDFSENFWRSQADRDFDIVELADGAYEVLLYDRLFKLEISGASSQIAKFRDGGNRYLKSDQHGNFIFANNRKIYRIDSFGALLDSLELGGPFAIQEHQGKSLLFKGDTIMHIDDSLKIKFLHAIPGFSDLRQVESLNGKNYVLGSLNSVPKIALYDSLWNELGSRMFSSGQFTPASFALNGNSVLFSGTINANTFMHRSYDPPSAPVSLAFYRVDPQSFSSPLYGFDLELYSIRAEDTLNFGSSVKLFATVVNHSADTVNELSFSTSIDGMAGDWGAAGSQSCSGSIWTQYVDGFSLAPGGIMEFELGRKSIFSSSYYLYRDANLDVCITAVAPNRHSDIDTSNNMQCATFRVLSVKEVLRNNKQVYYTSLNQSLNLQGFTAPVYYRIFDSLGRLMKSGVSVQSEISLSELDNGIYFVQSPDFIESGGFRFLKN